MYKLLICDDESLERTVLRKMIERRYRNILVLEDARTGAEAVRACRLHMPDILLMDIKMPELNGLDSQKQIIAFHPGIKTVLITAYCDFSYAREAIKYNVVDFLVKPVSPATLHDCLDKILHDRPPPAIADSEESGEQSAVQQAIAYIDAHYLQGLRIADVAGHVHLSEKYFSRYFKQRTGVSFTDYVNRRLMEKAKKLLLHTEMPVYQIAMELQFSDATYFSKVFRRYEGATPLQFRRKNGKSG